MTALKEKLNDSSLFRKLYIADLFFCNIAFLQLAAYVLLVLLFVWGVGLAVYKQRTENTFFKMRFGLWVGAFLIFSFITMLANISPTILHSLLMLLHVVVCFFVFYGMHTEQNFDFRQELYSILKFIVYVTTIANLIGIFCLLFGISFEWYWIKFTIYENRFTGVYVNPNLLGFSAVVAAVSCHMLYKEEFTSKVNQPSISKLWIYGCLATNIFSLILCDSNASFVLALGYVIVYLIYIFFSDRTRLSVSKIIYKIIALFVIASFVVCSSLMLRTICQTGFSVVVSKTNSIISVIMGDEDINSLIQGNTNEKENNNLEVTFGHENKNIDSGRFKLWEESVNLFKISPIIGISNGNIVFYSEEYSNGALSYSYHKSDFHNGYLTLLVSTGIIGFMLFGIFGFRFAKHSAQHLFLQKKPYKNDIYPCLFAFLFAYLIYALFERALLYDISFMVMWFWLMMGYLSCYIAKLEPMLETQYLFHRKRITRTML